MVLIPLVAGAASVDQGVLTSYVTASQMQHERLKGSTIEVDIEANLPKLKRRAHVRALRKISDFGRITYETVFMDGDRGVRSDVISRFLGAETQAQKTGDRLAITPENYRFHYVGLRMEEGRRAHIYRLTPKRKATGLFKGELWIDDETRLPLREQGRFVKSPSIFLKSVNFVRAYEIRDGLAIPKRLDTMVDTRLVGEAHLSIDYSHFALDAGSSTGSPSDSL